jgi:hypothetical protein
MPGALGLIPSTAKIIIIIIYCILENCYENRS